MWNQPAFIVGDRQYLWLDVVLAAMWRGEWAAFETRLREGLACETYADETDDPVEQAMVDAATAEFRYDRELITAEETEAWIAAAGLSLESWSRYFVRQALRARWADRLAEILAGHAPDDDAVVGELPAEAICSATLRQLANALAGRAAVSVDQAASGRPEAPERDRERVRAVVDNHRVLLDQLVTDDHAARLSHIAGLHAAFEYATVKALTPQAIESQVETNRLDWMRVDLERLPFPDESMVRETRLCCQEDGLSLVQLAARIDRHVQSEAVRLDACESDLRTLLLSAEPGELLGPLPVAETFQALVVLHKHLPVADDPEVRQLAEAAVVAAMLRQAESLHVRWLQQR